MMAKPIPPVDVQANEPQLQSVVSTSAELKVKLHDSLSACGERPNPLQLAQSRWERNKPAYEFLGR